MPETDSFPSYETRAQPLPECLKICLIGGIYGSNPKLRRALRVTPETLLESEFRARGHDVGTFSHSSDVDLSSFDVVHVHHLGLGALRAACDPSRVPFVFTSHDGPALCGFRATAAKRAAAQFVMASADAVVGLTATEALFQQRAYRLKGAAHLVIPNGADSHRYFYKRTNRACDGEPWRLLYVGQLIDLKGIDLLLLALAAVTHDTELLLVFHTDPLRTRLQDLVFQLGLEHRVRFLGPREPAELAALYQEADLLVLPSRAEALPTVLTEAMLCGMPIIATRVGGIPEQLGPYGLLVDPGDAGQLAAAIDRVLSNHAVYQDRGEAMSRYASAKFSTESMATRHLELYATLLRQERPRRHRPWWREPFNTFGRVLIEFVRHRRDRSSDR